VFHWKGLEGYLVADGPAQLNHGLELGEQIGKVAVAVFHGEVVERDRWRIDLAARAHAMTRQNVERLGVRGEKVTYRRIAVNALHPSLHSFSFQSSDRAPARCPCAFGL